MSINIKLLYLLKDEYSSKLVYKSARCAIDRSLGNSIHFTEPRTMLVDAVNTQRDASYFTWHFS